MANADYTNLSDKEKQKLISKYVSKFREALGGIGTNESLASRMVKELRQIGSSDLINDINEAYDEKHDETLREAIIGDYSGDDEDGMLNSLGFAIDRVGDKNLKLENQDIALLSANDRDLKGSSLDLINKDIEIPNLNEKVKLGSGVSKFIKAASKSTKAPATPATPETNPFAPTASKKDPPVSRIPIPTDSSTMLGEMLGEGRGFNTEPTRALAETVESEAPQRGSRAFRKQSAEKRKAQIEADDKKAAEMSSAIPNTVRSQLKLPRTRGTKETSTATPSGGGASGGSGSNKAGLDYLRSREDMMARDKAAKEAMRKEALERRRTGEQRFATLRPEILAQQAERARLAEEKRQANEIKSGSGELLGRVIRDKSGKIIGTSTTKAGRRALGSGYKGATGTFDFSKPADSFAELDARDAVKGRMASRQQQVVDLMSGGPTEAQEKQIRPFDTGLAVNPDADAADIPINFTGKPPSLKQIQNEIAKPNVPTKNLSEGSLSPIGRSTALPTPSTPSYGTTNQPFLSMQRTPATEGTTDRLMREDTERQQRDRRIQANQFMDARGDAKQQAIDTARLRDTAMGGANYSGSNVTTGVEPDDSRMPSTNPTANEIKKKLKKLKANQ